MCDTIVATPPATAGEVVWIGKNSDREPGEAQLVEHLPRRDHRAHSTLRCTWTEVPQARRTWEVVLSRPYWMWGAEMGINEHGVAIANQAVFTRLPVAKEGLTGMDLLRLGLERSASAEQALRVICRHISLFGQGGRCGYRKGRFRYHNAFVIADAGEVWVLETAAQYWAARRVEGIYALSNALTITDRFERISPGAIAFARQKGWCGGTRDFDFARCFGDRSYGMLAGAQARRACARRALSDVEGRVRREDVFSALQSHNGLRLYQGWRMQMPCAHASWLPTRQAGQTTGSMVCGLGAERSESWFTGTSSPCVSVFKPVVLGQGPVQTGPTPGAGFDDDSLFWRHERLHRLLLTDYEALRGVIEDERSEIQQGAAAMGRDRRGCDEIWARHRRAVARWTQRVGHAHNGSRSPTTFRWYWNFQNVMDQA